MYDDYNQYTVTLTACCVSATLYTLRYKLSMKNIYSVSIFEESSASTVVYVLVCLHSHNISPALKTVILLNAAFDMIHGSAELSDSVGTHHSFFFSYINDTDGLGKHQIIGAGNHVCKATK